MLVILIVCLDLRMVWTLWASGLRRPRVFVQECKCVSACERVWSRGGVVGCGKARSRVKPAIEH